MIGTISTDLDLSLAWEGLIGASALIGIFIGGPLGGMLSDKFGRKPLFTVDAGAVHRRFGAAVLRRSSRGSCSWFGC